MSEAGRESLASEMGSAAPDLALALSPRQAQWLATLLHAGADSQQNTSIANDLRNVAILLSAQKLGP
jgi:hypothetical protein